MFFSDVVYGTLLYRTKGHVFNIQTPAKILNSYLGKSERSPCFSSYVSFVLSDDSLLKLFLVFRIFSPIFSPLSQGSLKERTLQNLEKYVLRDVSDDLLSVFDEM